MTDNAALLIIHCLLPYLAGIGFYHAQPGRSALALPAYGIKLLRILSWVILLVGFWLAFARFGVESGIFIQFFCSALALTLSLFIATRWPLHHCYSGILAISVVIIFGRL